MMEQSNVKNVITNVILVILTDVHHVPMKELMEMNQIVNALMEPMKIQMNNVNHVTTDVQLVQDLITQIV
jgi:hypothetical protein